MPILNPVTLCTHFLNFSLPVPFPLPPGYPFHCTLLCHSGPRSMRLTAKSWSGDCPVRQETLNQPSPGIWEVDKAPLSRHSKSGRRERQKPLSPYNVHRILSTWATQCSELVGERASVMMQTHTVQCPATAVVSEYRERWLNLHVLGKYWGPETNHPCVWWSEALSRKIKSKSPGASLVAQWLRVCLPMQGTRVRALVREDPTCRGAAGPVSHSY